MNHEIILRWSEGTEVKEKMFITSAGLGRFVEENNIKSGAVYINRKYRYSIGGQ